MRKLALMLAVFCLFFLIFPHQIEAEISFEDVTSAAGLIEPLRGFMGHAGAWGDINDDGYPELFVGTYADSAASQGKPDKLLLNNQGLSFTQLAGPFSEPERGEGRCSGAAFADFDDDGDLDLVVSHNKYNDGSGPGGVGNFIYRNNGGGDFEDVTPNSNLSFSAPFTGRNTFVFDYDGDGRLDIFMQEDWVLAAGADDSGGNSRLMRNQGNFVFQDVTSQAGFPTGYRKGVYGLGGAVGDINGDSWPDVYFAHHDRLYINNQDGTFREKKNFFFDPQYSLPPNENIEWPCGADLGDLDRDGDLDIVIGEHFKALPHKTRVFLNQGNDGNGDPVFTDVTDAVGIKNHSTREPHVQLEDFNNDGWLDILTSVQSGLVYQHEGLSGSIPRFSGPTGVANTGGIGYLVSCPAADYDRDGRMDLFGAQWDTSARSPLLRNTTSSVGNFVNVRVSLPSGRNRHGLGATVKIYQPGQANQPNALLGMKVISVANGFSSGTEDIVHFGAADYSTVDIVVNMPCNGPVYTASEETTNRLVTITGDGGATPTPSLPVCFGANNLIDADDVMAWVVGYLGGGSLPDTNGDGRINSFELGYLVLHWGEGCQ